MSGGMKNRLNNEQGSLHKINGLGLSLLAFPPPGQTVKHRKDCETALEGKERSYLKKGFIWFYLKKGFIERKAFL